MSTLRAPRLTSFAVITLILTAAIAWLAPHLLSVTLYKLSLVTLAAVLGYWIDRTVFHYLRPHELLQQSDLARHEGDRVTADDCSANASVATIRRAIIMAAVIIAISLGA